MNHQEEWEKLQNAGLVRGKFVEDEFSTFEDLCGDTYNFEANPEIPNGKNPAEILTGERAKAELARQKRNFRSEVHRKGVWGYVTEYYNGTEWVHVDSVWGFVGQDAHGYAEDLQGNAIKALEDWSKTKDGTEYLKNLQGAVNDLLDYRLR